MKKFRTLVVLLIVLLTVFSFNAVAYDQDINIVIPIDLEKEEIITPLYEPVCGTYPSHRMVAHGFGTVLRDGEEYILLGSAWQCSRCYLIMITEGTLYYGEMATIGKYAILHDVIQPVSDLAIILDSADTYGYTSRNYLNGYKFYYSE